MEVDCGESRSRESAVAGLLAVAGELRRSRASSIAGAVFGVIFMVMSLGMALAISNAFAGFTGGSLFSLVLLAFTLVGLIVIVFSARSFIRYNRAAAVLEEMARMVEAGLLSPEEVCSKNVGTLLAYYRVKRLRAAPRPPRLEGF